MKKLLTLALALVLCLSLAACGGNTATPDSTGGETPDAAPAETVTLNVAAPPPPPAENPGQFVPHSGREGI